MNKTKGPFAKAGAIKENGGADKFLFGVLYQNLLQILIDYIGGPSIFEVGFLLSCIVFS